MATWNVGGLSAANALEMLQAIGGNKALSSVQVFLFQEIVTEPGKYYAHNHVWKLAFGKQEGEWRGEGVAFRKHTATHTNTQVMTGGVAIVLRSTLGHKWGALSAHVPHHATTAHTETLMAQWGECAALRQCRVLVGMDANEQFTPSPHTGNQQAQAHTSRAEAILAWQQRVGLRLPPQDLATPSHFPYATMLRPRRLDYVFLKGCFSLDGGGAISARYRSVRPRGRHAPAPSQAATQPRPAHHVRTPPCVDPGTR